MQKADQAVNMEIHILRKSSKAHHDSVSEMLDTIDSQNSEIEGIKQSLDEKIERVFDL
jgi:hypothetical protein